MQGNLEQHCAIKFCVKLKKTKQEAYAMLNKAYRDEEMNIASFYWWFNRFSEENEQDEDELRNGTSKNACKENIQEVERLVLKIVECLWEYLKLLI